MTHDRIPTPHQEVPVIGSLTGHFAALARYNRLANETLYAACAMLDDAALRLGRPAFFRSILGTLNHILIGDRIWMARFRGLAAASTGLDAILHQDFSVLAAARASEDAEIEAYFATLDGSDLSRRIGYVNNQGGRFEDPLPLLCAHFFNHQTHHRGQVHDLLSQTSVPPPSLDMHRLLKPTP